MHLQFWLNLYRMMLIEVYKIQITKFVIKYSEKIIFSAYFTYFVNFEFKCDIILSF